ncbi:MAG: bifunctional (p)ppGpp synthetase/guanosine-3',5'-bis(diphosphate) 3'-pyrophosphohydrolase [Aquimonas sp.]|jgi:guanosine-3',5'-bis(diphosphate) 3'-pyrophosphohydrolase|nr:bifunctional (p)ppGpp synthetase/guanosine-3',5'-bis(diphosphate) 3'-pyrophosphohydrolase [Aquimonas sp.]
MQEEPLPLRMTIQAVAFAAGKHRHQRRKDADASPYINHPIALAEVLSVEANISDATVLCAALLHDTLEDTETTVDELRDLFGDAVTAIVVAVSDDKSLPKETRKALQIAHAAALSHPAKLVKLADKICNLRDLLNAPPADWTAERKLAYFQWAEAVVAGLRGTHAGLEAILDDLLARADRLR